MLPAMDIQTIWIILATAAVPIAGFVGFVVQLQTVRKLQREGERLQHEGERLRLDIAHKQWEISRQESDMRLAELHMKKLELEIAKLSESGRVIVVPPWDTVRKINDSRYLDIQASAKREPLNEPPHAQRRKPSRWIFVAVGIAFLAFLAWAYWLR